MKTITKIILSVFLTSIFFISNAQDAEQLLIKGKMSEAKAKVDNDISNPELAKNAKTWYLRAYVYNEIAKSEVYAHLDSEPERKALDAAKKCKELDTDKKLDADLLSVLLELSPTIYNKGIKHYNNAIKTNNNEEFKKALYYFDLFYESFDVIGRNNKKFIDQFIQYNGVNPNKTYIYSGYAAEKTGDINKAHKMYRSIINLTASNEEERKNSFPSVYYYEGDLLFREGKNDEAEKVISKGLEVWPDNQELILLAINFYKKKNDADALYDIMEKAVANNPNNITLLSILAKNYNKLSKKFAKNGYISTSEKYREQAINTYKKAIALNPKSEKTKFALNYNLGVIYFNKAARAYKNQQGTIDDYKNTLKEAMPYLETAYSIKKDNPNIKKMLTHIYTTLELNDKLNKL